MSSQSDDRSTRPVPALDHQRASRRGWLWIGLIWLVAFNFYFYSFTLPNNKVSRWQVWSELPYYLLLLPVEGGPPSGWQYLSQRWDLVAVAAAILGGACGAGHLLLRLIPLPLARKSPERGVLAVGIGLSALSLLTLGCGLLGMLRRELLGGAIIASMLVEVALQFVSRRKDAFDSEKSNSNSIEVPKGHQTSTLKWVCVIAITPFILAMALGAMLPSTDFDVKEYHLEGPKEFFLAGRVEMLPHNVYTSFPFHTEMLSLLAMVLRGDWFRGALAGQLVLMCFAPLTAWVLYAAGRRFFSPSAGWLAALVYLTTPWTFRISTIAYTEGGLSFYLVAALLAAMIAIEQLAQGKRGRGSILLTGMLAGSAMACKYPGVLSVVIPLGGALVAAPFFLPSESQAGVRKLVSVGLVFAAGVLMTVGPWLLKNSVETGNPVYPLLYSIFDGKDWDAELNAKWKHAHSPADYNVAKIPFWIADVSARNDWLSPLLYGFAPLALLLVRPKRTALLLWLYVGWLFVTWWTFTHRLDRFWVPMLPVVALLAGIGAASLRQRAGKLVAGFCIAAALLFNLGMVLSGLSGYNHFLADLDSAREWTARLTSPEIVYLNSELPRGAKVLCVGEAEVFDAKFPVVYNTVFDKSIFQEWTADEKPGVAAKDLHLRDLSSIRKKLHNENITHVLVNWREILRYRMTYGYTDYVTLDRFNQLQKAGVLGPPLTFASLIMPGLSDEEFAAAQKKWQGSFHEAENGSKLFVGSLRRAVADREDEEEKVRQEIDLWSPALVAPTPDGRAFIDWQVYPVLP